ncbi:MAG: hypothetical protein LBQ81_07270 [Zoogloeaceae bacterium]|jgi:hypothetical protein|nr:hypothetical protein [Zoogloeaceae bacterium]
MMHYLTRLKPYLTPKAAQKYVVGTWFLLMSVALPMYVCVMRGVEDGILAGLASIYVFPVGFVMALLPFGAVAWLCGEK